MSFDALRLKNRKNKSWTRYFIRRSKSNYDFDRYRQARNDLRSFTRSLRSDYERNLSLNVKQNPKAFWKYINSRIKVYPTINDLQCSDGSILYIGYFCTSSRNCNSKSPGPDGWPLFANRETAEQICRPLSLLFTKSLESGILPQDWKWARAQVTPKFKKGDRHLPNNYHPISLTSPIIRLMESIIKDEVYENLSSNHLLSVNQHGFVPGRSCITQFLIAMDYCARNFC